MGGEDFTACCQGVHHEASASLEPSVCLQRRQRSETRLSLKNGDHRPPHTMIPCRMNTLASRLGVIGRKTFPFRLPIGLAVAILAARWIDPNPFFAPQHRVIHALALLVIVSGLVLRAWGAGSAGLHTRSGRIEAPRLATSGPFAHLRNPIYLGSILLGAGMSMLIGDPRAIVFAAGAFANSLSGDHSRGGGIPPSAVWRRISPLL